MLRDQLRQIKIFNSLCEQNGFELNSTKLEREVGDIQRKLQRPSEEIVAWLLLRG